MIGHQSIRRSLPWRHERSLPERILVERHLEACEECRALDRVLEENRRLLRGLASLRPPEELRQAVLAAAEESEAAVQIYGPLLIPFVLMPVILGVLVALFVFGAVAWAGLFLGLGGLAVIADRRGIRPDIAAGGGERLMPAFARMARAVLIDLAGIVAGAALFGLIVLAMFRFAG